MRIIWSIIASVLLTLPGLCAELAKPNDPYFAQFNPELAPEPKGLLLHKNDKLAICGDSITEQKMYSRIMETYLTVCRPDLNVSIRQYGWGGETAPGFLARMTNDCLRFKPTIATTCYGMNDHGYGPYREDIGKRYRDSSTIIVRAFKAAGARVVQGSPGCVSHKDPPLNTNLCQLRNIGVEIAESEHVGFADVFWPMLTAEVEAHKLYGTNYWIAGADGVHPGWAGHLVMAYAFLKALGLDGEVGTFTVDLASGKAQASKGHEVISSKGGEVQLKSSRYPFCAVGKLGDDNSIRSGMSLVPFNEELNRLTLIVKNGKAQKYTVTWGKEGRSYTAEQLAKGINLAADFVDNPFMPAFSNVDKAVTEKQKYETKQIKQIFHGLAGSKYVDMGDPEMAHFAAMLDSLSEKIIAETEKTRTPFVKAIKMAFVPVTHSIIITPE